MKLIRRVFVVLSLAIFPVDPLSADGDQPSNSKVDFVKQVEPILRRRCYSCHGPDKQEGGLRLDLRRQALAGGDSGTAIEPGKADKSRLVALVSEAVKGERMPPKGALLTKSEIQQIKFWIDAGAAWPKSRRGDLRVVDHWAFQPIKSHPLPAVRHAEWPIKGLDRFVLHKLEREKTRPSAVASRQILIRRVYLDLLGLPPSPRQWRQWMADRGPDWYQRMVEHLLASPHFGERWGRVWLDLARYADSDGYEKDRPRPNAFQWRNWVLDAVNRDLPFDQFTEQQIAGDLLPGATAETRLATGFHRNTLTNREGGIDKEEDRVKQAVDRVNTISTVWLGLTVRCAQCHSHKYDPISQREYYRLYAFFNNSDEHDFLLPPTVEEKARFQALSAAHKKKLQSQANSLRAARRQVKAELPKITAELLRQFANDSAAATKKGLAVQATFDSELKSGVGLSAAKWSGKGKPTLVAGRVSKALQLDGSSQRVELGRPIVFQSDKPFTIAAWIQHQGGVGAIVTRLDEAENFRGVDFTSNEGMLEVHLVHKWPTDAIKVTTKSRVKKGQWQHVMMTYDGSRKASGVRIYINGSSQPLQTHYDNLKGSINIDEPLRLGSRKAGTFFKGSIDEVHVYRAIVDESTRMFLARDAGLKRALEIARLKPKSRTQKQTEALIDFVVGRRESLRKLAAEVARLEKNSPKIRRGTGMAIGKAKSPRRTFVHIRGEFLKKGGEVQVGVPAFLPPLKSRGAVADRLDLARWMLAADNPLTPRVAVNRVWQHYFGSGLVSTSEDFGTQAEPPTHPRLLDYLAGQFVERGWSMKWLHREIVLSATYRQSSAARPDLVTRDPANTWLARRNRARVDAEMVRDIALTTSGLLDSRTHGPSVFPPLPPGIIELAFVDVINRGPWKVSPGGDRYRRAMYTFFQRTAPYPLLALFDAPDSNETCTRRPSSNTPLQALMLWNDPVFVECSRELARRLLRTAGDDRRRIELAFVIALSRQPTKGDRGDVQSLLNKSREIYGRYPALAKKLTGTIPAPAGVTTTELAAWISVVRTILNLDEFITRE